MRSKTGGRREFTTKSTKDLSASEGQAGTKNAIRFKPQRPQPGEYKSVHLDLLMADNLITKLKARIPELRLPSCSSW